MYKFSSHASAGTGVHARRTPRLRHSAMAVSIGLLLAAPVYAQQTPSSPTAPAGKTAGSAVDLDTVEVRGVRASLIKSQVIKRDASQIVYSVGFNDLSYFNRTFRSRYGVRPTDLRRMSAQIP